MVPEIVFISFPSEIYQGVEYEFPIEIKVSIVLVLKSIKGHYLHISEDYREYTSQKRSFEHKMFCFFLFQIINC